MILWHSRAKSSDLLADNVYPCPNIIDWLSSFLRIAWFPDCRAIPKIPIQSVSTKHTIATLATRYQSNVALKVHWCKGAGFVVTFYHSGVSRLATTLLTTIAQYTHRWNRLEQADPKIERSAANSPWFPRYQWKTVQNSHNFVLFAHFSKGSK